MWLIKFKNSYPFYLLHRTVKYIICTSIDQKDHLIKKQSSNRSNIPVPKHF